MPSEPDTHLWDPRKTGHMHKKNEGLNPRQITTSKSFRKRRIKKKTT